MRFLRTLSTSRLILLIVAVVVLAGGSAAIAVAAGGGGGPTPPTEPLDQAIHDALSVGAPTGVSARISFTNRLFPSGALPGSIGSALMSGGSGRLWATNDGRGRLELQSDAGDVQIVWNRTTLNVYDASSNTVYRATLPAGASGTSPTSDTGAPPALAEIDSFLTKLGDRVTVSAPQPTNVAGQPAYSVTVSPKHDGGLLASAELAWDVDNGVPLQVAVSAQASSSPALELRATDISYGAVPTSAVDVSPPAGANVVDIGALGGGASSTHGDRAPVTGLDAVQAAAGFTVTAPDTLVGLPRKDIRLLGAPDSRTAVAVYGEGLGALLVIEHEADAKVSDQGGPLASLPSISIGGTTAHELATQLGTALAWQRNGTAFILAGSLPPAAAEAAARALQ